MVNLESLVNQQINRFLHIYLTLARSSARIVTVILDSINLFMFQIAIGLYIIDNKFFVIFVPFTCGRERPNARIPAMSAHNRSQSRPGPTQWFNLIDLFTFGLCSAKQRDYLAMTLSIVLEFL